jgi:hypothetical protein
VIKRSLDICDHGQSRAHVASRRSPGCRPQDVRKSMRVDQGFVLGDEANASFTTAESFNQPQDSALFSQRADFDRLAGGFAARKEVFRGVNTRGGPTGCRAFSKDGGSKQFAVSSPSRIRSRLDRPKKQNAPDERELFGCRYRSLTWEPSILLQTIGLVRLRPEVTAPPSKSSIGFRNHLQFALGGRQPRKHARLA